MRTVAVLAAGSLVMGCGRREFDPLADGGVGTTDGSPDAPSCGFDHCDDFERAAVTGGTWDTTTMMGGGAAVVQGGALVVTLPDTSDSLFLVKQLPAPTTSLVISLKIGYATTDAGTNCELDLVALTWDSGACTTPFGFYLVRDGTGPFNLQETNGNVTCTANRDNYTSNLDNTGLHDVQLTVTVGNPGTVKLVVDGATVRDMPTLQPVPASPVLLRLGGVLIRNAAAPWTITYDDVVVDVQ